jgi:hypothetical protein
MPINVQVLAELDDDQVTQARAYIAGLLQEDNESLDLKRGVVHDLLFHYSAILAAAQQMNIDKVRRSSSLLAIAADPTLADDDVVDRVLSNYRVTRTVGTTASGSITIVVNKLATLTIPSGGSFDGGGQAFVSNAAYSAVTNTASVASDSDRILTARGDGTYSFTISASAVEVGVSGMVRKDSLMVPGFTIPNYVTSFASSDFSDGLNTEDNSSLLIRLQEGIACRALSNRINMYGLLRDTYPSYINSSVIGYGDGEMLRDQHSILPVSYGGRADWYIRSQELPQLVGFTKTATLIEKTVDGYGTWQFSVARDDAPGFYDVTGVAPLDADDVSGNYAITADIRANDMTNILGELTPDIETVTEGAYSRWQSAVIQFKDSNILTAALTTNTSTQDYAVTIRAMSDLKTMQTLAGNRSNRNYAGDVLVRAPVPAFTSIAFTVNGAPGDLIPSAANIRTALASYVNNIGFCGMLSASALSDIIHNYLLGKTTISAIDMFAKIRQPDGVYVPIRSSEALIVPDDPGNMVTARTVAFILDPADIAISARTVNIPEI